jgi:hypothetical protein
MFFCRISIKPLMKAEASKGFVRAQSRVRAESLIDFLASTSPQPTAASPTHHLMAMVLFTNIQNDR